jgi:uncharacterized protein YcaQ
VRTISTTALRRLVIGAQGYAARSRRGRGGEVEETIRALSCVQLDSITAVERSHRIVLGSRVGAYPRQTVSRLLADGRVFEFWAHLACLIPVEDWPLHRAWMTPEHVLDTWRRDALGRYPELAKEVLAAIRERGPLTSGDFGGRRPGGGMWDWKPAKMVLEALWNLGELVVAGRVNGFQRLYDLPERVLPREVLDAPVPDQETRLRELVRRAVLARGALTDSGVANHWHLIRLNGGTALTRPVADELVAAGVLERLSVEDGGASVLVPAGAALDPPCPSSAVLLSPFDNLLWDRRFVRRVFGFEHVIEIYKRAPERRYGYYVLPFLWRDRIVGRADLKSDRAEGALTVNAFHLEPGVRRSAALDEAFSRALDRLRRTVGLERVVRR